MLGLEKILSKPDFCFYMEAAQLHMETWYMMNLFSNQWVKDDLINTWCWNYQNGKRKPEPYSIL